MSSSEPLARPLSRRPEFARGLRDMTGTVMGIAAWGLLTGIAMAKSDLALPLAVLMSVIVFAGSAQQAALVAVVAPEVFITQGRLIGTWTDAHLPAVAAAAAYYVWRRGLLGTIVSGTAVLLAFRLGLGW